MQRHAISLDGKWRLGLLRHEAYERLGRAITDSEGLGQSGAQLLEGTVPGNFELDLVRAGEIPDPYEGDNILSLQSYEDRHVFYARRFTYDGGLENPALRFEGIDTVADVYLNGRPVGHAENMFVAHEFAVPGLRRGENELLVHIRPACIEARNYSYGPGLGALPYNFASLHLRKAAHSFGWDIMPRAVSAGLWRPVSLVGRPRERIRELYVYTQTADPRTGDAKLGVYFDVAAGADLTEYTLFVEGVCGASRFALEKRLWFTAGRFSAEVPGARLWWPRGRGEASLYAVRAQLRRGGEPVDTREFSLGIRTAELRTGPGQDGRPGDFRFLVNGEPVFILGTNWVPADAFHSRDAARLPRMLRLLEESGCNAVRCWGGGVYEPEEFYDYCDRHGILVWQDFMMACGVYPQDAGFRAALRAEADAVVRRLRGHACLLVWAGDNECDASCGWDGLTLDPDDNRLTREDLPAVLRLQDPFRPYLPSSPFYDRGRATKEELLPEIHLWGPRDYFKGHFYRSSRARFASETGYHGCPAPESVRRFLPGASAWPWQSNPMWVCHASSPEKSPDSPYYYRIGLMARQIRELFGTIPDNLADFALASQLAQAEAMKFLIEMFRTQKWERTGIIWWNLIDGWPQFSDAVVDYYFRRKAAFFTIRRAQQPLCLTFAEPADWEIRLIACNDTRADRSVRYRVTDLFAPKSDAPVLEGRGTAWADRSTPLGALPFSMGKRHLYRIEWSDGAQSGGNHYLAGPPPFDFCRVRDALRGAGLLEADGFDG